MKLKLHRTLRRIKCVLSLALLTAAVAVQAAGLPANVAEQIPKGFTVLSFAVGQLTDDHRQDYLVVVHHPIDTKEQASLRPALIFTQNSDGSFKLAARNDTVVMQADAGGQCDPFTDSGDGGLAIKDRYFTVQNGVACGAHWTDYITFHYDTRQHDWLFRNEIMQSWHFNPNPDGEALLADPSQITRADSKHPVTFAAWRPKP